MRGLRVDREGACFEEIGRAGAEDQYSMDTCVEEGVENDAAWARQFFAGFKEMTRARAYNVAIIP